MSSPLKKTGFAQGLYAISSTAKEVLGTVRFTQDGRKFVYCKAGASALAAGKLNVAEDLDATWVNETGVATAGVAIGDRTMTLTLTAAGAAITENQFAGGYLQINDSTGEGHQYLIQYSSAVALSGTSISIALAEPIRVALTSSSDFTLVSPAGWKVTESATASKLAVGVSPVVVTAAYFFWNQVAGDAPVLIHGTPAIAVSVDRSLEIAGAVKAMATVTKQLVGYMRETGVDGEYKPVRLMLG